MLRASKENNLTLFSVLHHPHRINLLNVLNDNFDVFSVFVVVRSLLHLDRSPGEVDDVADGVREVVLLAAATIKILAAVMISTANN